MEKEYNLKGIRKLCILCKTPDKFAMSKFVIMEAITEKQEKEIDSSVITYGVTRYYRKDKSYVENKDIYVYGELDFTNQNDIELINKLNLVDLDLQSFIYKNIDYQRGVVTTKNGKTIHTPTINPVEWLKFNHLLLGQPKRIIIYRVKSI